ncbi:hypothetical protein L4C36_00040 [Photobacterium japonica]|uniref:hypothetical protein n=1 Tax=Photobacterium japonica TaxID=2910235 RepID=UPI003D0A2411
MNNILRITRSSAVALCIAAGTLSIFSASVSAAAVAKPASAGEIQGRNQFYAARYKAACDVPLQAVQVAGSLAEAPQLEAIFTDTLGYQFTLNANGEAYLQLAIKEWNEKMLLMTNRDVTIAMDGADITGTKITNLQCPDLNGDIYHINTHEWGSYVLRIHGKPNQKVAVGIVKEVVKVE